MMTILTNLKMFLFALEFMVPVTALLYIPGWFPVSKYMLNSFVNYMGQGTDPSTLCMTYKNSYHRVTSSTPEYTLVTEFQWNQWPSRIPSPPFALRMMFPPQNGLLSSLPYLLAYICGIVAGQMSDFLLSRKIFSVVAVRKLFTTLGKEQPG